MCQPGRPFPHGLSQAISPALADFQSAKSPADRFFAAAPPPSPCWSSTLRLDKLPVVRVFHDVKEHVAVDGVGIVFLNRAVR